MGRYCELNPRRISNTRSIMKKGKGAKIVIVNLKMCNYNSGKLKGAKLYTVNQNGAKLGKCAKIVIVNLNVRFPDVAPPSVNDVSYI